MSADTGRRRDVGIPRQVIHFPDATGDVCESSVREERLPSLVTGKKKQNAFSLSCNMIFFFCEKTPYFFLNLFTFFQNFVSDTLHVFILLQVDFFISFYFQVI